MSGAMDLDWLTSAVALPSRAALSEAQARQAALTKPAGSLGYLEEIASGLAALQGSARPLVTQVHISVFAGDHGVAAEGVSAFPQSVTAEMVKNFAAGGAAISVIARSIDAQLEVINLGTAHATGPLQNVRSYHLGPGTANFVQQPAMTREQLRKALNAGRESADKAHGAGAQLFIGGEMGIGNTTSATALACALLSAAPADLTGPGTGLDRAGLDRKARVIQAALDRHQQHILSPVDLLQHVGGFEIAALAGAYLACAQAGLPVLVDGFISSVAALVASRINPGVEEWLLFSHLSAEPGHRAVLTALHARPLLDLGMRLGEGSGAAVAVPLLRLACDLHNQMATFDEARVSGKKGASRSGQQMTDQQMAEE